MSVLLINPPVFRACEPPAGLARLAGAFALADVPYRVWDASIEGMLGLIGSNIEADDTWTGRAVRSRDAHLAGVRHPDLYRSPGRYRRAVADLSRLLARATPDRFRVGLAGFDDRQLSPLRSGDLIKAAERPDESPFFAVWQRQLDRLLTVGEPVLAGISVTSLDQAVCAFALAGLLRRRLPGVRIVLGGGLVTSWLSRPGWRSPFAGVVDELVAGPGETRLLELAGVNPPEDSFPSPVLDRFPLGEYLAPGLIVPYSGSTGCWWGRCAFCPERAEGAAFRSVVPSRAVADLSRLAEEYRPAIIHLCDNSVTPALLDALAVHPPGARWYGFVRPSESLADPAFCRALAGSGCAMLSLGVESGDPAVLEAMGKGVSPELAGRCLRTVAGAGIRTYVYLLFGTPWEDEAAARRTLDFAVRHAGTIDFLNLALFNLPAFAPEVATLATAPFYDGDLSLYREFRHPRGWDRPKVRRFVEREFRRHPAIAPIVRRDPPVFTSSHAPLIGRRPG